MAHRTTLTFTYESPADARLVTRSVRPEVGAIQGDRTTASLDREGDTVTVTIEASDLTALRAGQNTWLTLIEVAEHGANAGAA